MSPPTGSPGGDPRGTSSVLGLVLMLAISFAIVGILVLTGTTAVDGVDERIVFLHVFVHRMNVSSAG